MQLGGCAARSSRDMTVTRSWTTILRSLAGAVALAALVLACTAATASARRDVDLGAPTGASETPAAGETPPAGEAPAAGESPAGTVTETPPPTEPTPVVRHSRHARRSSCAIALEGPSQLSADEAVVLKGQLTCAEAGEAAAQQVQIFERTADTPGFVEAATALTEPDGSFTATLAPAEAKSFFYARVGRSRSAHVVTRVTPLVTLVGPARGAVFQATRHGRAETPISFSGTVSPDDAGALVTLQRERPLGGGRWRPVATAQVGDDGGFAFEHAFRAAGPLVLRARLHRHAHTLAAVSEALSYEVAQAQNPALTIAASPQSLAFGESVTISGKLAGPAGATVTLEGRSDGGAYAALASTATTEGGAYTFTQAPAQATSYRVTSGVQRSVAVRLPVMFALAATPSTTNVASGEGFTISGTLAPASPGARVYLQRLRPGSTTWATLGFATVLPDSTFEFEVPAAVAGTASYRVSVGRMPGLAGTATHPVAVTTAPSS